MELSLKKVFGGSKYLIQSIHAKKLQVRIFSRLGPKIQDNALTNMQEQFPHHTVHDNSYFDRDIFRARCKISGQRSKDL